VGTFSRLSALVRAPGRSGCCTVKALEASQCLCAAVGDSAVSHHHARRTASLVPRRPRCWAVATPRDGPRTLRHKDPLAYDPGMRCGKLHDSAEDCGHLGMGLFICGLHAGLWCVGLPWHVPHVATVLL